MQMRLSGWTTGNNGGRAQNEAQAKQEEKLK
jgi:hypothetical protein